MKIASHEIRKAFNISNDVRFINFHDSQSWGQSLKILALHHFNVMHSKQAKGVTAVFFN